MKIDFANLRVAYDRHKEEFNKTIYDVISSASYIMGPEIQVFENKLASYTGCSHALTCSSGTDALLLALMSLDIKNGDEVITSPFTFISTAETIALLGAKPVFVDIKEDTYNIDTKKVEDKITKNTKAIIGVSLFGQVADMNELNFIAKKYNLSIIEDAAQSFGATYYDKKSCNISKLACTSFFPSKPLGCFGDGGAVFTNDKALHQKMSSLRLHGQIKRYEHSFIGLGARMDTLQAAVLNVKIDYYNIDIKNRQQVANKYTELLKNNIQTPIINHNKESVWAQYSIQIKNRALVQKKLSAKGIPTAIYYPKPLHLQKCFEYLGYKKGDFPVSEKVSKNIISLPMNPYINDNEINYIVNELKAVI